MRPDFTLLRSLPSKVTLTALPGLHHDHFTSMGFGAATIPELATVTKAGPEIGSSLGRMAGSLLTFFGSLR